MIGLYIVIGTLVLGSAIAFGYFAIEAIQDGYVLPGIGILVILIGLVVGVAFCLICPPEKEEVPPQPTEVVVHIDE